MAWVRGDQVGRTVQGVVRRGIHNQAEEPVAAWARPAEGRVLCRLQ